MTGAYLFKKGTYKTSTFVKYVPNECKRRYTVICPPGSNNSSFVHKISRKERKCKSWLPKIKKKTTNEQSIHDLYWFKRHVKYRSNGTR